MALSPDNYDIREITAMLESAENLLFPGEKKDRPLISYQLEKGSVRNIFKTSIQHIIAFNAIIGQVNAAKSIDFLDLETAKSIEQIQDIAKKRNYRFSLSTSLSDSNQLHVNAQTRFYRTKDTWVDAEFYFYGKITNAGGKGKANIHLLTDEHGTLIIQTPLSFFENLEKNIIHKGPYGVRATGRQHAETGEMDFSNLKFVELLDYNPAYDEDYLNKLIEKATPTWSGIEDKQAWLNEIRGRHAN